MTKKQVKDFEECCLAWVDAYCDDHNCKPEDIPIAWAVETAEMHAENLECELYFDGEEDEEEQVKEYYACLRFARKNKRYCK